MILLDDAVSSTHAADTILVHDSSTKPSLHLSSLSGKCFNQSSLMVSKAMIRNIFFYEYIVDADQCNRINEAM